MASKQFLKNLRRKYRLGEFAPRRKGKRPSPRRQSRLKRRSRSKSTKPFADLNSIMNPAQNYIDVRARRSAPGMSRLQYFGPQGLVTTQQGSSSSSS